MQIILILYLLKVGIMHVHIYAFLYMVNTFGFKLNIQLNYPTTNLWVHRYQVDSSTGRTKEQHMNHPQSGENNVSCHKKQRNSTK